MEIRSRESRLVMHVSERLSGRLVTMKKERIHRCKQNPHSFDVKIRYCKINVEEWHWVCEDIEYNISKPDKQGRAKKTTPKAFHIILIQFCPFCGKELHN